MEAVSKMLPCPFCGQPPILRWLRFLGHGVVLDPSAAREFVECQAPRCMAKGPLMDCEADAIAAWNARWPVERGVANDVPR